MIDFRLDQRLRGRVDAADVLQDAYLEVARRIDEYVADPQATFFIWARQITWQTVLKTNRRHLATRKRDANREIQIDSNQNSSATSLSIASRLIADIESPSATLANRELFEQLYRSMESMDEIDREILALRHFEQLTNQEVSDVLEITKTAASNRYVRALERLREIMSEVNRHE